MAVVILELTDEGHFAIRIKSVLQAQAAGELRYTEVPLQ